MNKDLGVVDLLELFGYDRKSRAKVVRHQDKRYDVHDLLRRGWLDAYQMFQSRPVFDGLDSIVSFVGLSGTRARLVGVYAVNGRRAGKTGLLPPDCPHTEWKRSAHFYKLQRQPGFESLENRVVIDWGRGALAWHQRITNKPVLELLPRGHLLGVFSDYLGFTLTHAELQYLFAHAEANHEWRSRLSAVAGVYLILATTTGRQYIGSASGADGIWGRWAAYAANGHGGNAQLRELVTRDPAYPASFSYSILQILPRTVARAEVLGWERRYMERLGTMATGLNWGKAAQQNDGADALRGRAPQGSLAAQKHARLGAAHR